MAEAFCFINPTIHVAFRMNHSRPLWKYRGGAMKVTMSRDNNQPYWASINDQIDAHVKKVVKVRNPVSVFETMYHLVFSAPRDTAPALCVAACELVGGRREQAMSAAAALHVFHAASFTHEHLPLSVRPSLVPRPRPMKHHAFGPDMELLIGDAMIPLGLELVTKSVGPAQSDSDRTLRVVVEMTRAIGSQGVVNGIYDEIQYNQLDSNGSSKVELIDRTSEKKEGGLHACGAACGGILGGGSEEEIDKLRNYGLYVGMIQGTLRRWTTSPKQKSIRVEELRELALKELEGFDEAKVEAISSLVEANLSHV